MNICRFGGYALCVSALISLLQSLWYNLGGDSLIAVRVVGLLGVVLFIAGLPAIQAMQPQTGRAGQVGLVLVGIGAFIAMGINLYVVVGGSDVADFVPITSALLGLAGALLVGWLTIRAGVFPAWIGWLLITGSVLNFAGGSVPSGVAASMMGLASAVALPAAVLGFGIRILQAPQAAAVAAGTSAGTSTGAATDGRTGV